jgi:protein TonB
MIALATQDAGELRRWAISGAIVILLHAGATMALINWPEQDEVAEPALALVIDLAPVASAPRAPQTDLSPGPTQPEESPPEPVKPVDELPPPKVESALNPAVTLAPPKPEPEQKTVVQPPAQTATAPSPSDSVAARAAASKWGAEINAHLDRFKRYKGDKGVALLAFSIDRQGHLVESHVVKSSGSALLDEESLALVRRADPFPQPPPQVPGARIDFTVPIRFNIR